MPAPVLGPEKTIVAAWFCPFAQRTLIAAYAKKPSATFHVHEITFDELYSKPQWFLDLNPTGLIPVISWQNTNSSNSSRLPVVNAAAAGGEGGDNVISITESLICNEFLEDAYPQPPLLPTDPEGKAAARLIINRFGDKFVPAFYRLLVRQDPTEQSAAAAVLDVELSWLVQHIDPQGPLAMSDQLTLVDCAVAPFLIRLYLLEHYRGYSGHKQAAVAERLQRYLKAAEQHPAVAATMYHPEGLDYKTELVKSYARYADGSANSMMARDAKKTSP